MKKIDAHAHLWKKQDGLAKSLTNGQSLFNGNIVQMMPPYMVKGENTVEMLIANMDYAGVNGAVITQEYLDGNQDEYLLECKNKFSDRIKICALYEEGKKLNLEGFDGVKIPASRLEDQNLCHISEVFEQAEKSGKFLSIDLGDGDSQTGYMEELLTDFPNLPVAIGHFGMVTTKNWQEQIKLARHKNCYIESGGLTWLFNKEFYPYPNGIRAIKEAAEICGMEKLMWGSDYPRTMVAITYTMAADFIEKSDLCKKELFLYENAKKFYGFKDSKEIIIINNMLN